MSVLTTTSVDEVLGRIVRSTRLVDASFLEDSVEWIPEAMGYMRTKMALVPRWKDVTIKYYKGRMPCGMVSIQAIQYGGCRLPYLNHPVTPGSSQAANAGTVPAVHPGIPLDGTSVFGSHLIKRPSTDDGVDVLYYETDLAKLNNLPYDGSHFYFTELDYFNTSFCDGCIRVHFRSLPLDDKGLPLIPDEENYKEALYYYCRAKMIGAGYPDKVFSEQVCMDRFEKHAEKAVSKISYPSVDEMDSRVSRSTRLVFPEDYWETYFNPPAENLLF